MHKAREHTFIATLHIAAAAAAVSDWLKAFRKRKDMANSV
jgi:hypothetical protein